MTQPQPLQLIPADMPLSKKLAAMTIACADVDGLSCGLSLGPIEAVPLESLYDWHADLFQSARRVEELIIAREKANDAAREAAQEEEAA